jgi:hypothetical protein
VDIQGLVQLRSARAAGSGHLRTIDRFVGMGFLLVVGQFLSNVSEPSADPLGLCLPMYRGSAV